MGPHEAGTCWHFLCNVQFFDDHVSPPNLLSQYTNIIQIWYSIAAACIKLAVLLLYLRVFSTRRRDSFDRAVRTLMVVICVFYFALSIAKICQCIPRARIWDSSISGRCVNLSALLVSSGLFNIVSDICILLVPLRGVWSLQIGRKRKVGIYAVFTVGLVSVLALAPAIQLP